MSQEIDHSSRYNTKRIITQIIPSTGMTRIWNMNNKPGYQMYEAPTLKSQIRKSKKES